MENNSLTPFPADVLKGASHDVSVGKVAIVVHSWEAGAREQRHRAGASRRPYADGDLHRATSAGPVGIERHFP